MASGYQNLDLDFFRVETFVTGLAFSILLGFLTYLFCSNTRSHSSLWLSWPSHGLCCGLNTHQGPKSPARARTCRIHSQASDDQDHQAPQQKRSLPLRILILKTMLEELHNRTLKLQSTDSSDPLIQTLVKLRFLQLGEDQKEPYLFPRMK